jgi:hypothetical protein
MPDAIETLLKRNLHEVFGERDAKKRREAIAELWTEDCVFIDHDGKSHGRDELDRAVAVLHQRLPGYVFSELRPVDVLHESGRLAWSYERPGQEPIKGVDVALVRDGRISVMLTFLDEVPAKLQHAARGNLLRSSLHRFDLDADPTGPLRKQPHCMNPDRGKCA